MARRLYGVSESLLYNWRSAGEGGRRLRCARRRHQSNLCRSGYSDRTRTGRGSLSWRRRERERPQHSRGGKGDAGTIEIALPNGARVCVDALVNEKALSRVLRAMRNSNMISLAPGTKVFLALSAG